MHLVELYKLSILYGVVASVALSWLGCHLALRDKAAQSLSLSQSITVGLLLGMAFSFNDEHSHSTSASFLTLLSGFVFGLGAYFGVEYLIRNKKSSKNTIVIVSFIVWLAVSFLIISYFPSLEGHMTQTIFGDLTTLMGKELWVSFFVSVICLFVLVLKRKRFISDSFDVAGIGEKFLLSHRFIILFNGISLALVVVSVYSSGLLFSMACLFLPTSLASYIKIPSLRLHYWFISIVPALGTFSGFLSSLLWERFSTVPIIVIFMLGIGGFMKIVVNRFRYVNI